MLRSQGPRIGPAIAGGRTGHVALGSPSILPMATSMSAGSRGSAESVHPLSGPRAAGAAPAQARAGLSVAIHLHERSAVHHSRRRAFRKMIARLGVAAGFGFPSASAHAPARLRLTSSPMTASIPARCRPISATRTFSTRCAIPSWRRPASRTSGAIDRPARAARASGGAISLSIASHLLVMVASNERPRLLIDEVNMKLNSFEITRSGNFPDHRMKKFLHLDCCIVCLGSSSSS